MTGSGARDFDLIRNFPKWRRNSSSWVGFESATELPEFANNPRHGFNFWFDRGADSSYGRRGRNRLHAHRYFHQGSCNGGLIKRIEPSGTAAARYCRAFHANGTGRRLHVGTSWPRRMDRS